MPLDAGSMQIRLPWPWPIFFFCVVFFHLKPELGKFLLEQFADFRFLRRLAVHLNKFDKLGDQPVLIDH